MTQNPNDPYPSDPSVDDPFTTTTSEPGYGESGYTEGSDYPAGTGYSGGTGVGSSSLGHEADTAAPSKVDEAKEQGRQVAGTAKGEARGVAETAKSEASRVTGEAKAQTQNLLHEARGQFREQASGQTERAAGFARGLGDNLQALTEGRVDEAGQIGQYAQQATDEVQRFARRIDERGFDGLVADLQSFARRRPGAFLLAAGIAGFATGRLLRGARDAASDDDGGQHSAGLYSGGGYDPLATTDAAGADFATRDYPTDDYDTTPRVTGPTSAGMANPSGVSVDPLDGGTTLGDSAIGGSRVRDEEGY